MQRHLHRTIGHFCRQHCRCRLYSTRPALQYAPTGFSNEPVDATTSQFLENTQHPQNNESSTGEKRASSNKTTPPPSAPAGAADVSSTPNKVDAYLASLRVEGIEPTLADLERLAPKRIPSPNSPKYAEAYNKAFSRLCRTFSKDQLRRFCHELHLASKRSRRKVDFAEAIMEKAWGWKNLQELEEQKRGASEILVKAFPLPARQLFLLLGKDGSQLLRISKRYNVHISVQPDPLSIRIEGYANSIATIEALFDEQRKSIVEETVELPTGEPLPSGLLQQASRTSNAFIENTDKPGEIRILAMNQKRLNLAKRSALRISVQLKHNLSTPFAALLPPPPSVLSLEESPSSYALFPFATQKSLPWTNAPGNAFRSRKVSEWLGDSERNFTLFSPDLSGRKGKLVGMAGDIPGLEEIISRSFSDSEGSCTITASTGHILITDESQRNQSSILPPFPGRWQYNELLNWIKSSSVHRVFVPCLPLPLHSAPPAQEKIVHRLIYRCVRKQDYSPPSTEAEFAPAEIIRAEVVVNRKKLEEPEILSSEPERFSGSDTVGSMIDDLLLDARTEPGSFNEATAGIGSSTTSQPMASDAHAANEAPDPVDSRSSERDLEVPYIEVTENSPKSEAVFAGDEFTGPDDSQELHSTGEIESRSEPLCRRGKELELLISLPDRPMDAKLTVLGFVEPVPVQTIPKLDEYFKTLKTYLDTTAPDSAAPEPPLFIEYGEDPYVLDLNASVRQSTESLDLGRDVLPDLDSPRLDNFTERRILTTTESIYDLESGQKLVNCEIACKAAPSGEAWASFLTDIDRLTSVGYKSKRSIPTGNNFTLDEQAPEHDNQVF